MRHDRAGAYLHYSIGLALGTGMTEVWYTHTPKLVCEHEDVTVFLNQGVHKDRKVIANRPDIVIKNKNKKKKKRTY